MKRLTVLVLAMLCLAFPALSEKHTVIYFYRSYCESCTPEEDFASHFSSVTGASLSGCDFTSWNVVRPEGEAALEDMRSALGLKEVSLPLAIVDGEVYQGAEEMNTRLARTALTWDSTDSLILYLYTPACESCGAADAVLSALPEHVSVRRGSLTVESRVLVDRIDISASPDVAQALFDAYGVPEDRRVTPIVFFGDHYLSGAADITARLPGETALGWAVGGPRAYTPAPPERPSLLPVIFSGLVAGLNTCALSMLLLFLSLILPSGRKAPAVAFLVSKFACYVLTGCLVTELFQAFNPHWLRPLARILMTGMGAVLIVLNLSDAFYASKGDLGRLRNQLPSSLRGRLHSVIRRLAASPALLPASVLLGFIVAGGEFLCAGQLYLMQLMSGARYDGGQLLMLFVYCLAFILPSAAVCLAVYAGKSQLRAASFFAEHMAGVKLLTALAMLVLILAAWLI